MKKGIFSKLVALLILFIVPISAKAVTFSVSKSADNLKPGGAVTVTVTAKDVSDQDAVAAYNLNIVYDTSKVEFAGAASSTSNIANSGNTINIVSKLSGNQTSDFEVAKIDFKVLGNASGGNAKLDMSGSCDINDVGSGGSCKYNSSQITVASLGTDASLSSLKIPNTTLKPGFSSNVTSYTATIQDITELTVNAVPTDSNAKIAISENHKSLQKGDNKIDVTVTSEDGSNKKVYTVVVTLNLTPTDEEMKKADATLKSLVVKEDKIEFDKNEKKYYITVPYEKKKINVKAVPTNEKAKVQIDGDKKLIVGKNTVKITITSEDKSKIETYQIIVTREDQKKEIVETCPDETSGREWIIFSICLLLVFTGGIVLGYFLCKKDVLNKIFKKKEKVKEEPVVVETLSDTIDLTNTVKDVKKIDKKKS